MSDRAPRSRAPFDGRLDLLREVGATHFAMARGAVDETTRSASCPGASFSRRRRRARSAAALHSRQRLAARRGRATLIGVTEARRP